ncbi:MAG: PQQ-binding-like beta-propeller repeat protein [Planctomycetales bacterium]|nr:PQQ-binding-like beta-propeller repeat protein [Planctomycetales bacterium]
MSFRTWIQRKRDQRRYLPPLATWLVVALFLVGLAYFRFNDSLDSGMANVMSFICVMASVITVVSWYAIFSAFGFVGRMLPLATIVLGTVLFLSLIEVRRWSGSMVPELAWRWQPQAHERLDNPAGTGTNNVDLLTETADDYPGFLGPSRNATLTDLKLGRDWRTTPPKQLWRQTIGAGWCAFAARNAVAVTMEQRGDEELVTCYDIATGTLLWSRGEHARHETALGFVGPRSTPTIHQGRVYAVGATGIVRCLEGASGELVWRRDLLADMGTTHEEEMKGVAWGRSGSPLVFQEKLIIPYGGPPDGPTASLAALNLETGETIWTGGSHQIAYASPQLLTLGGMEQIVIVSQDYVTAHDPYDGAQLWEHPWPGRSNANASVSQPVGIDDQHVFLSKGYSHGAELLRVGRNDDGRWKVESLWHKANVMKTKLTNVVVRDGYVFGIDDGIMSCIDMSNGRKMWKSGRYGHGQIVLIDDVILVQAEDGRLLLIEANPKKLMELAELQAIQGQTWNNPCVYGKRVLVRNSEEAACYELP